MVKSFLEIMLVTSSSTSMAKSENHEYARNRQWIPLLFMAMCVDISSIETAYASVLKNLS